MRPNIEKHYVYVAKAFKQGDMVEELVHVNYNDAVEDIKSCAEDADSYKIDKKRLYSGGQDLTFEVNEGG